MASEKRRIEEVEVPVYVPAEEFRWALHVLGLGVSAEQMDVWEAARWDAVYGMVFDVFLTRRLAEVLGTGADALARGMAGAARADVREALRAAALELPQGQGLVFRFALTLRKVGLQLREIAIGRVQVATY